MKAKINIKNIISYLQGKVRYRLFYSKFAFLIPNYIREQIEYRINSMDMSCYSQGYCNLCGCQTTALQMANKACDKPCYPSMINRRTWESFSHENFYYYDKETSRTWFIDKIKMKFEDVKKLGTN